MLYALAKAMADQKFRVRPLKCRGVAKKNLSNMLQIPVRKFVEKMHGLDFQGKKRGHFFNVKNQYNHMCFIYDSMYSRESGVRPRA